MVMYNLNFFLKIEPKIIKIEPKFERFWKRIEKSDVFEKFILFCSYLYLIEILDAEKYNLRPSKTTKDDSLKWSRKNPSSALSIKTWNYWKTGNHKFRRNLTFFIGIFRDKTFLVWEAY